MRTDKTIALCIPAYNAEAYLPRLLISAGNQLIPFDEVFVYNDCSTDATAEIAAVYGANVISGDINRGCSYGKNVLAEQTSCDWIHFHDADDDLLPDFTTRIHEWIKSKGAQYEVLLLNFKYVDIQTGAFLGVGNYNKSELHKDPLRYAIKHKIVNFGLYSRSAFMNAGGFDTDPQVLYNEDNAFHQRLAKAGLHFDFLSEVTCINYRYGNSMSAANRLKCARANYHVLKKTAIEYDKVYPFEIAEQLWICATMLGAVQDWEYVKKCISICENIGYKYSFKGSKIFNFLIRVHPFGAIWFREKMIRLLKPQLRN